MTRLFALVLLGACVAVIVNGASATVLRQKRMMRAQRVTPTPVTPTPVTPAGDSAAVTTQGGIKVESTKDATAHLNGEMNPTAIDPNDTVEKATVTASEDQQNLFDMSRVDGNTNGPAKVVDEQHPATPLVDENAPNPPQPNPNGGNGGDNDCGDDPCDKLNGRYPGLRPAHIVESLSNGVKPFVPKPIPPHRDDLWDEFNGIDGTDPEMIKLKAKLKQIEDNMLNARNWIKEVHMIISHYQDKIGKVAVGLKLEAQDAERLKKLITTRHALLERKRLEAKLVLVNKRIEQVEEESRVTGSHSESLTDLRSKIQRDISKLQEHINAAHAGGMISTTSY